jgi:N6-adenosine-specific RNA methylase IME4
MSIEDICALPVGDLAAPDTFLFLWATGPHLRQAFDVLDAWGFAYSGVAFTWAKLTPSHNRGQLSLLPLDDSFLHVGCGYTTRKNSELCLLGRRGSPKRLAADVREMILAPVRQHSRKPIEFYNRVERFCAGPRLELFSRQSRPGWTSWGAEAGKFDAAAA